MPSIGRADKVPIDRGADGKDRQAADLHANLFLGMCKCIEKSGGNIIQ